MHTPHGNSALGVTMLSNSSISEPDEFESIKAQEHENACSKTEDHSKKSGEQYEAMNPSLHYDFSSEDSVESPPKRDSKNLASKQNKQVQNYTLNQQVPNMYPWGCRNKVQQFPPSVLPMVNPPAVQNPNKITISFNTTLTVPNLSSYPMFNQGFGKQQQFLDKNTQHNNKYLLHHQTNSNISNNDNFMK